MKPVFTRCNRRPDDDEEGEHVVIGRLIRRMRISDYAGAVPVTCGQRSENIAGHGRRGLGPQRFP